MTSDEIDSVTHNIRLRQLGLQPYESVWRAMSDFTSMREQEADEIWMVQHPPVFTQGQAGKAEHILQRGDIPLVKSDRGGQVTYHGPGQLVAYPLLNLKRLKFGVRELVSRIEQATIILLAEFGIEAALLDGAPGVYVDGRKIASLGLRVRRGCSFHGVSLNVNMDLEPFKRINPCGYSGLEMTQLSDLNVFPIMRGVELSFASILAKKFGYAGVDFIEESPDGLLSST